MEWETTKEMHIPECLLLVGRGAKVVEEVLLSLELLPK
jgi:hypothetical protein